MEEKLKVDEIGRQILEEVPYSGLRKMIGNRMISSLQQAPQAMISIKVDMSGVTAYKNALKGQGVKVTYTDLLIKVIGKALEQNPVVNSARMGTKIIRYKSVHIGVAVGTEQGLYVPVIRDVQDKSLTEVSAELKDMAQRIRQGELVPEWFQGGTFTISNLGMYDIEVATPIINQPEGAILCVGKTTREPVVQEDDSIAIVPQAMLSMTLDHSIMDGMHGSNFLLSVRSIMTEPEKYF